MVKNEGRVLIVEDDLDGQRLLAMLVEHLEIVVDVASNVAEAEQYLFQTGSDYQAVLVDLALPDKDGWQLLSEIQSNPRTADLCCIAVTAFHTSKLRQDTLRAGFKAYFPKPVDSTLFLTELAAML